MELFVVAIAFLSMWIFNARAQAHRIVFLSGFLRNYQIEKLMETLADGYLRALGEQDPERSNQVWGVLAQSEAQLCQQVQALAADLEKVPAPMARFSRLGFALPPKALELFAWASADLRPLMRVHAEGINQVAANADGLSRRDRAYALTAEMLLLQHTCHWYCRSKNMAHARLVARHQTAYAQVVNAVSAQTRNQYQALLARR